MLHETFHKVEQEIIGTIWQNSEILGNMQYLADEIGSRFAGTESERKAQDYIIEKLKEYGYGKAYLDEFTYHGWRRGPVSFFMTNPIQREFEAISLAMSPGGEIEGKVVNLGSGSPAEFEALSPKDVEGNIVLCSSASSPTGNRVHRRTKYGYAVEYGATGFIFMNHNPGNLPPTGSLRPAYKMGGEIPGVGISLETGKMMLRLAKGKPLKVRVKDESIVIPKSVSANIVAELNGTSKEGNWIVIGGHFDGHDISQGAMDNLSGTVVTLELARVFKHLEKQLKRNIRFICFACEEIGVTGSTCYVDKHREEMKHIDIMINLELGGLANKDGTTHAAFTVYQPLALKEKLVDFIEEIQYPMTISEGTSAASDHWPFYMQGVPTMYMHAEPSPMQTIVGRGWGHTAADMMDKVDPRNLQEGAMVAARLLLRLATQEESIADHTNLEDIIENLEKKGIRKTLEIQKKWHPHSVR